MIRAFSSERYYEFVVADGMVWYGIGMVYVDLYSAIVAKFSNALCTLVPRKQPSFQGLFEGVIVLLCEEVVGRCRMG